MAAKNRHVPSRSFSPSFCLLGDVGLDLGLEAGLVGARHLVNLLAIDEELEGGHALDTAGPGSLLR